MLFQAESFCFNAAFVRTMNHLIITNCQVAINTLELSRPLASLFIVASSTSRAMIRAIYDGFSDSSGSILVFEIVVVQGGATHRTSEVRRFNLPSFDTGLAKESATTTGLVNCPS